MRTLLITIGFSLLFSVTAVCGQTSDEKLSATRELVALMNQSLEAEEMVRLMTAQNAAIEKEIIDKVVEERTDLTPAERDELRRALVDQVYSQSEAVTERILAKLELNKLMNEIMVTLYDKHFTLDEVRELISFYKTPTGQKLLAKTKPLVGESMALTQERLVPKLLEVMDEMKAEREREIAAKANQVKPKKSRR